VVQASGGGDDPIKGILMGFSFFIGKGSGERDGLCGDVRVERKQGDFTFWEGDIRKPLLEISAHANSFALEEESGLKEGDAAKPHAIR